MLNIVVLTGLAANAIAANLTEEVGPFGIFLKWQLLARRLSELPAPTTANWPARAWWAIRANAGKAMGCVYCMTFWTSAFLCLAWAIAPYLWTAIVIPFAAFKIGSLLIDIRGDE